ncbi:hypothetical protein D3C84_1300470 [compost metagenome]
METVLHCRLEQCLAACRVGVGLIASDTQLARDVIGSLRHRIGTKLRFHSWIGKARTDRAVEGTEIP